MVSYKRVSKPVARRLYNKGCTILLLPCKVNDSLVYDYPYQWIRPFSISLDTCLHTANRFERAINEYCIFNCNTSELGYYPHYFVSEEEYNKHMNI